MKDKAMSTCRFRGGGVLPISSTRRLRSLTCVGIDARSIISLLQILDTIQAILARCIYKVYIRMYMFYALRVYTTQVKTNMERRSML